jgi:hypothetical protein
MQRGINYFDDRASRPSVQFNEKDVKMLSESIIVLIL